MDDKIIPHLVARFLSWKLPPDFRPDAGISFAPKYNNGTPEGGRHEPSGTNLLNAEQAFAMFRHVLDHPAVTALPQRELLAEALAYAHQLEQCVAEFLDAYTAFNNDELDEVSMNDAEHGMKLAMYAFREARAAADKIRASLTQEKQT